MIGRLLVLHVEALPYELLDTSHISAIVVFFTEMAYINMPLKLQIYNEAVML